MSDDIPSKGVELDSQWDDLGEKARTRLRELGMTDAEIDAKMPKPKRGGPSKKGAA